MIKLGTATIAASDQVTVTVYPTSNPITASSTYVIDESTSADTSAVASATYTIAPGPPVTVLATAGSDQSAQVNTAYAVDLGVTVYDFYGNPVPDAMVTFMSPSSAPIGTASGTFDQAAPCQVSSTSTSNQCVLATDASGVATTSTLTANLSAGSFEVKASTTGSGSATFNLTNTMGSPPPPHGVGRGDLQLR